MRQGYDVKWKKTFWFRFCDILEKVKIEMQTADQWLPGTGFGGGDGCKGAQGVFLGGLILIVVVAVWLCICQNSYKSILE